MSELPKIAQKSSMKVEVKKDQKYYWCSCGLSVKQPFCDGSHKDTEFKPIVYIATEDKIVGFCGCKVSNNGPLCDGSHRFIKE